MSFSATPNLKSPRTSVPEIKKIPLSAKSQKPVNKVEIQLTKNSNDIANGPKPVQIDISKARQAAKSPKSSSRISLQKSKSPPSSLKVEDSSSRLKMIKEQLSPTSQIEKAAVKKTKEASEKPQIEITLKEVPAKPGTATKIALNKLKSVDKIPTSTKSQRTTSRAEIQTPVENKKERLASRKANDREENEECKLNRVSSSSKLDGDVADQQKDKEKKKKSVAAVKEVAKTAVVNKEKNVESVPKLSIGGNSGKSTQRLASPQSLRAKTKRNETPVSTGRNSISVLSIQTPVNAQVNKNIVEEEEKSPVEEPKVINMQLKRMESRNGSVNGSRNGSCSPSNENRTERAGAKNKKLGLIIPTVQISTDDLASGKVPEIIKHQVSTTRAAFAHSNVSRESSPQVPRLRGNKSARLLQEVLANASVDQKLEEKSIDYEQMSLFPSKNSDFYFQMKYFKPIEDSMLDHYIQTVNDSQKLKGGDPELELDRRSSGFPSDKSRKEFPRSRVGSPLLTGSPSLSNISVREVVKASSTRHASPTSVFQSPSKSKPKVSESKTKSQVPNQEQVKRASSPTADINNKLRSPSKQAIPKSPPRTQNNSPLLAAPRSSIDIKEEKPRSSFSRRYPKLAEEMESIPIGRPKSRGAKSRGGHEGENKFSNLDKLLAQIRINPKIESSLPETEDSEKGLFYENNEAGDESMNVESSMNKSFARTFIKFNN